MISENDPRLRGVAGVGLAALVVVVGVGALSSMPMGNNAATTLHAGASDVTISSSAAQLCAVQPAAEDVVPQDVSAQAEWLAALPESFPRDVGEELVKQHNEVMAGHPGVLIGAFVNRDQPEWSPVLVMEEFAGSGDLTHVVVCDPTAS